MHINRNRFGSLTVLPASPYGGGVDCRCREEVHVDLSFASNESAAQEDGA